MHTALTQTVVHRRHKLTENSTGS